MLLFFNRLPLALSAFSPRTGCIKEPLSQEIAKLHFTRWQSVNWSLHRLFKCIFQFVYNTTKLAVMVSINHLRIISVIVQISGLPRDKLFENIAFVYKSKIFISKD